MIKSKICVIGANGFIGQHLVNYLAGSGYEVVALIRRGSLPGFDLKGSLKVDYADVLDLGSLKKAIPQKSIVVNLAVNGYHPTLSYEVNVKGLENIIKAGKERQIAKLIHFSTQATKIKRKGVYSKTKLLADEIVKRSGIKYSILRPSLVYGEGEKGLVGKIMKLMSSLPVVPVFGDGETQVYSVYVKDLCKYVEWLFANGDGKIYDAGSVKPISYNYFYKLLMSHKGKKVTLLHIPVWVGIVAGRVFEFLKMKNPPFYIDNVLGSTQEIICDSRPIIRESGIKTVGIKEGLAIVFGDNKLKVGVVGLGKMGLLHLSILKTFEEVKILALVDNNPKLFKTIQSMGIEGNYYQDIDEALKQERLDMVWVLTPTFTHVKLIEKCLSKGVNVFVEKPAALNVGELKKLRMLEKKYNKIISVGYTLVHTRVYKEIKRIVDSEKLGKVKKFLISYEHGEVLSPKKGWMFEKAKSGGGVLMNPGPHLFSIVNFLFGVPKIVNAQVKKIYSEEVDDEARVILDYGVFKGEANLSWSVPGKWIAESKLIIEFERGEIKTDGRVLWVVGDGKGEVKKESDLKPIMESVVFNINPDANGEAYAIENSLFVKAVRNNDKKLLISDLEFAINTESIIHKSYE
ncbi:MAG: Gfo/Idh/MocA family oxidoreductase [Candidatus Shapirobacteria bacterium]